MCVFILIYIFKCLCEIRNYCLLPFSFSVLWLWPYIFKDRKEYHSNETLTWHISFWRRNVSKGTKYIDCHAYRRVPDGWLTLLSLARSWETPAILFEPYSKMASTRSSVLLFSKFHESIFITGGACDWIKGRAGGHRRRNAVLAERFGRSWSVHYKSGLVVSRPLHPVLW
jgi:hypothetical protein